MKDNIQQYYKPLLGYINKRIGNTSDAEDLIQDVFLKLSQSDLGKIENLQSWLYTITRNSIIDYYRKKKLEISNLEEQFIAETSEDTEVVAELSQCIAQFIDNLPDEYKRVLVLYEIEGIPQKEIAKRLDMNYVTVRSKVQRGRSKLKAMFIQCCDVQVGGRGSLLCYSNKSNCC